MTPNDLDAYLKVLKSNNVGAAILHIPANDRTVVVQVTFNLDMPEMGETPTPGGWKSPNHLDNPDSLDAGSLRDYSGSLPS